MTSSEIKSILSTLGGTANKRLGQHFLIDTSALDAVIGEAHLHPGMLTLEIGPGLGVLTNALLEAGHDVVAIERDARFVNYLTSPYRKGRTGGVTVIRGDAADLDWMEIVKDREWQLVSNLPYAISSLSLRLALWSTRPAENVVVMLQKEVAERVVTVAVGATPASSCPVGTSAVMPNTAVMPKGEARPSPLRSGKTSLLSLMVALASSETHIVKRVPPGAFYPPPKVDSAILRIEPMPWPEREARWGIDPEKIMELAKRGFAHPRKLLASNIGIDGSVLVSLGLNPKARAEDLSPDDWSRLTQKLA